MKKLFGLLVLTMLCLGTFTACEDDDSSNDAAVGLASECNISSNVKDLYEDDAIRLALRLQQNGPANGDITIPTSLIDRTLGALSAIYNSEYAARDSVIDVYEIHALEYPSFDKFTLQVDTSVLWVQEWVDGNRLTGNADIDYLMNSFGLDVDGSVSNFVIDSGETISIANLTSSDPLNLQGLIEAFENVEGVLNGDFSTAGGDGNDIQVIDNGASLELWYSVGYDSITEPNVCMAGCDFRRIWKFNVQNSDCSSQYISVEGDPAP